MSHVGDRQHVTPTPADLAAPELLPCPLCGGDEVYTDTSSDCANMPNAGCVECDLHLNARTIAEAIAAWNRRAHAEQVNATLAEARAWISAEAEARGDHDDAFPADRQCAAILDRLNQPKGGEGKV